MKNLFSNLILLFLTITSCNQLYQEEYQTEIELINHSYSNSYEVLPKHLNLNIEADFDSKTLEGFAEWDIETTSNVEKIIFDIRSIEVSKTEVDGKVIDFQIQKESELFGSALIIPISNKNKKVKIYYKTKPNAEAIQWLSSEQTKGKPFLYTQSEAILARTWIPCMDLPQVRFTYDATIKCPSDLLALMSASNPKQLNDESVYYFEMTQPIPSYLMALSIGDLVFAPIGENTGIYAEPSIIEDCKYEFEDLEKMVLTAEKLYGKYRWGRYDLLVLPASFPFGGMENPQLTFVTPTIIANDKSLVSLVAHELAHSWSGNLVTNRTWEDFWLNEGFTVYFEARIMEELYGKDYTDMIRVLDMGDLKQTVDELMLTAPNDTKLYINLEGRNPDDGMSDIAYDKGRFFLQTIEEFVGREKFDNFLNQYFNHYAFKTISTKDFLNYLDKHLLDGISGAKDSIGVDNWVHGTGLPSNFPAIKSTYLNSVDSLIQKLTQGQVLDENMFNSWTTHHFLYFFRNLPEEYYKYHMEELDSIGSFTKTHNAEIACDWFRLCIKSNYIPAQTSIEDFLIKVGRRKFLAPLYSDLLENSEWNSFAKQVFEKAGKGYHSVSYNTIKQMFDDKFGS